VGSEPEITFHLDQEPDWAQSRRYLRIVGIPLSPWRRENGGLLVEGDDGPEPVELDPGDAVRMDPDLAHSGGINLTGAIRYGVYFRWLEDGAPPPGRPPGGS
jgi:ectoine hydroxylase-related dioxygenase (phytanoyl-CoA dioxygenase family)